MRAKMVHIGFNHFMDIGKIVVISNPKSSPIKHSIQEAKENGLIVDSTNGRRTKAVIFTTSNWIVLSALEPDTITGRIDSDVE